MNNVTPITIHDDLSELTVDVSNMITSGPVYTIAGSNGISPLDWATTSLTVNSDLNGNTLDVKGDANFEGDIKVKGKSLVDAIENIEKRLAILHPNPELEEKWERLKALGNMYRELEAEIIEKEEIWKILKK